MDHEPKKIFLVPLGCPKNQVDGEIMLGKALARGHRLVDDPEEADVLVVNTCAFIEEARAESIETILGLAAAKDSQPARRLVVTGCMAERYGSELTREMPEIDALVGTGALDSFTAAIESPTGEIFKGAKHYLPTALTERALGEHDGSAYLKVSEGCDHDCSFCVIPSMRGRHESRSIEDVAAEAQRLVGQGVVEVNLVAQDLSAYGRDQGHEDGLAALLGRLGEVGGLERVRCLYLYPSTLSDGALEAIEEVDNVVRYIDIPLQHADSDILRRMRRHRDTGQIHRIVERVRRKVKDPVLRTAFIVGFPGETEAAFERLVRFVEEVRFDRIAVFAFSPEQGSPAYDLPDRVDPEVAVRRRDELLALQEGISGERLAGLIGTRQRVLVCGRDESGCWTGRSDGQAPEIDGVTYLEGDLGGHRGRCLRAEITGADCYDLFAVPEDDSA